MPIKIQSDLPACKILEKENIFVMTEKRAASQDIRPLKIAIVNLMPTLNTYRISGLIKSLLVTITVRKCAA